MTSKKPRDILNCPLRPTFGGPHVVLLGAGASRAVCPDGDKHGRRLPLMNDLVEAVGLQSLIDERGLAGKGMDFEGNSGDALLISIMHCAGCRACASRSASRAAVDRLRLGP